MLFDGVVVLNEILKSIELGFSNNDIVFAGVGKSDDEIIFFFRFYTRF